ncbi:MAG: segregation and condensation protein A [Betaproteobacteria bacterium RBG_16_66_20]|nr:MAG: segregation and condensation protein A [Betaproteobacteria bacterium RBG_16_66_20]
MSETLPLPAAPFARIYGEPLTEIPADLYIPPDALEILLDAFQGPLDLLLYLIRKQNLDVLDIPMAPLTRQYLEYVELMRAKNLELAAEYLVMAAMLIEIKSRMLLPRPAVVDEEEDPRAELVRRLLEYEQMKKAAQQLDALPQVGRDVLAISVLVERTALERLPEVHPRDLAEAWRALLFRARMTRHHRVSREELSVREHMSQILRQLKHSRVLEFTELFEPSRGVAVLVVTFLALLELAREALVDVTQSEGFAPIYIRIAYAEPD